MVIRASSEVLKKFDYFIIIKNYGIKYVDRMEPNKVAKIACGDIPQNGMRRSNEKNDDDQEAKNYINLNRLI